MILHTTKATPLLGYCLAVRFNTGESGDGALSDELNGEIFDLLRDPALFETTYPHTTMRTLACANGAGLAPEFLLSWIRSEGQNIAELVGRV